MTKSFDEWIVDAESWSERDCYEAGQKSRQAEVDELQKRIGEAVEHIEDYYGVVELSMIVDILNGNQ